MVFGAVGCVEAVTADSGGLAELGTLGLVVPASVVLSLCLAVLFGCGLVGVLPGSCCPLLLACGASGGGVA